MDIPIKIGIKKKNTTLYACWIPDLTITFDKDGGVGGTDSIEVVYNKFLPEITLPSKENYKFIGYYDQKNCSRKLYYDNRYFLKKWDKEKNTTLYACWKKLKTKITFDKDGGNSGTDSIDIDYLTELPDIEKPLKEGYFFKGYYEKKNCRGNMYYYNNGYSGKFLEKDTNITLYACWKKLKTKITFDKQGGVGGTDTIEAVYNEILPNIEIPRKEGYVFSGYFGSKNCFENFYYGGPFSQEYWNKDTDTVLYACWAPVSKITFDKQGGSGGTDSIQLFKGEKFGAIKIPNKYGYKFYGYYDKKNCLGNQYYSYYYDYEHERNWDKDTDTVLYACWRSKIKIIFDKDGGVGGTDNIEIDYLTELPNIEFPTKEGYIFNGYYDKKNCLENRYYNYYNYGIYDKKNGIKKKILYYMPVGYLIQK